MQSLRYQISGTEVLVWYMVEANKYLSIGIIPLCLLFPEVHHYPVLIIYYFSQSWNFSHFSSSCYYSS